MVEFCHDFQFGVEEVRCVLSSCWGALTLCFGGQMNSVPLGLSKQHPSQTETFCRCNGDRGERKIISCNWTAVMYLSAVGPDRVKFCFNFSLNFWFHMSRKIISISLEFWKNLLYQNIQVVHLSVDGCEGIEKTLTLIILNQKLQACRTWNFVDFRIQCESIQPIIIYLCDRV